MSKTKNIEPRPFGYVDIDAEHGSFLIESAEGGICRLFHISRTERGYPRHEVATLPVSTWKRIATAAQRELLRGMEVDEVQMADEEDTAAPVSRTPRLVPGENLLSPLIFRELAVLLWSLMEDEASAYAETLLAGWRQLAREERWWLYSRASNPTQRQGRGWRRALFYALTDPADNHHGPGLFEIMEQASSTKKKVSPMPEPQPYSPTRKPRKAASPKKIKPATTVTAESPKKKPSKKTSSPRPQKRSS